MNTPLASDLRPLTLGEIISIAWEVFTKYFGVLIVIVGVIEFPVAIVTAIMATLAANLAPDGPEVPAPEDTVILLPAAGIGLVLALIGMLLTLLSTGAAIRAVGDVLAGDDADFGRSYHVGANRFWRLVGLLILQGLAIGALALTIIGLPVALWLFIRWAVAQQALVLENTRVTQALGRSWALVSGQWWRTLGIFLVIMLLALIPSVGADAVVGILTVPFSDTVLEVPIGLVGILVTTGAGVVGTLFGIVGTTVLYYDLRAREAAHGRVA